MSIITITGRLVTPDDAAIANATIRFIATSTFKGGVLLHTNHYSKTL